MPDHWTNNPVTTSTPIKAVHINELRRAVDNYRFAIGLPRGGWTNDPITNSTPIRAVHFTELKSAIQVLWNFHQQGTLPNWSVGSAPSTARTVRASDMNDLRTWTDLTDPPPDTIGVNVDPLNTSPTPPTPARLLAAKFQGVRLVSKSDSDVVSYIASARSAGLQVVAVVAASDSPTYYPPDTTVVLQVDNEPDNRGIPEAVYADLYAGWRINHPGYTMFTAGFGTGDPNYYWNVLRELVNNHPDANLPNAVAIHVYNKHPDLVSSFIDSYTNGPDNDQTIRDIAGSIPAVVTEWNPVGDDMEHTDWIVSSEEALSSPGVGGGVAKLWSSWFPWTTAMDSTTPGIVSSSGVSQTQCTKLVHDALGGMCP